MASNLRGQKELDVAVCGNDDVLVAGASDAVWCSRHGYDRRLLKLVEQDDLDHFCWARKMFQKSMDAAQFRQQAQTLCDESRAAGNSWMWVEREVCKPPCRSGAESAINAVLMA